MGVTLPHTPNLFDPSPNRSVLIPAVSLCEVPNPHSFEAPLYPPSASAKFRTLTHYEIPGTTRAAMSRRIVPFPFSLYNAANATRGDSGGTAGGDSSAPQPPAPPGRGEREGEVAPLTLISSKRAHLAAPFHLINSIAKLFQKINKL